MTMTDLRSRIRPAVPAPAVPAPPGPPMPAAGSWSDADGSAPARRAGGEPDEQHEERAGPAAALAAEVDAARQMIPLQADEALAAVLSGEERRAERELVETLRRRQRRQRKRAGLAAVSREARQQRVDDQVAKVDAADQVWHRRAVSTRRRLLNPASRLARLQRVHRYTTMALLAVMVAGIAWSAVTVQHNITAGTAGLSWHTPSWWTAYGYDPLLCVPLVVLLIVRGVAASWGRTFGGWQVRVTEAALLAATTLLNVGPYLPIPGIGTWQSLPALLGHLVAPGMVATSVVLQPMVSAFIGQILIDAYLDADEVDPGRLDEHTATVLTRVVQVHKAAANGDLPAPAGSRWPSTEAIRRYLAIGKRDCQGVTDGLIKLQDVLR